MLITLAVIVGIGCYYWSVQEKIELEKERIYFEKQQAGYLPWE